MRIDTRTPEALFTTLFLPLYPPEARGDLEALRRDDANPAKNPAIYAQLDQAAEVFARMADGAFGEGLSLDGSDASVHRLGAALTRERRDRWALERGPEGVPLLAYVVIHGAAYVGACVVKNHGGLWQVRRPLWESLVRLASRAGEGDLSVFSWWLRALSDGEIGRGTLAERYRANVEVPCARPEELPVIAPEDRKLPRLKRPRYDTLHRYLKAHLPELRDLGRDFPSPERFAEMAFEWLDFQLLGGGRVLLMHGPTDRGVHLFWLDAAGFSKALYYPADAFPEHKVTAEGDKVRVIVPLLGKPVAHELLWWGPLRCCRRRTTRPHRQVRGATVQAHGAAEAIEPRRAAGRARRPGAGPHLGRRRAAAASPTRRDRRRRPQRRGRLAAGGALVGRRARAGFAVRGDRARARPAPSLIVRGNGRRAPRAG